MEQDKLVHIALRAEEGASLSGGSLRLYGMADSLPVGCVDLYAYDPLNRRAAVGIMVAKEHRRRGYALAMLRELEQLYRGTLHNLYADIAASNLASLTLFRTAGYAQCGLFKEWLLVDGHPVDTIRMQRTLNPLS